MVNCKKENLKPLAWMVLRKSKPSLGQENANQNTNHAVEFSG